MGGFGVISNMISSIKMNRNQLPKSKSLSEQAKLHKATNKGKPLRYANKMTKKERELFLHKLKVKKLSSQIQLVYVFAFILIAVVIVILLIKG